MKDTDTKLLEEAYNKVNGIIKESAQLQVTSKLVQRMKELADRDGSIETGTEEWINLLAQAFNVSENDLMYGNVDLDMIAFDNLLDKLGIDLM